MKNFPIAYVESWVKEKSIKSGVKKIKVGERGRSVWGKKARPRSRQGPITEILGNGSWILNRKLHD